MAEDRMLSDEILLALIKKNSGGGGGGTDDYNKLKNQPQIGGVTVQGNKSLSDFGIKNEFIGTKAQWNALTAEQRKAYDTYQFMDDFMEGRYIYLPTIFSEEEKQVGVWKNGKPLYQKVWTVTLPSSHDTSGGFVIDSDVSYIDETAISGGYIKATGGAISALNGGIPDLAGWGYGIHINPSHELCLLSGGNTTYIGGGTAVVILQYTKSTDAPGSGIWTPSGEIAHHYSTDDQIVGTWADGSTIFERFIEVETPLVINSNNWAEHIIDLNGKQVVKIDAFNTDDYLIPVMGGFNNGELEVCNIRPSQITIDKFIVQYTKIA